MQVFKFCSYICSPNSLSQHFFVFFWLLGIIAQADIVAKIVNKIARVVKMFREVYWAKCWCLPDPSDLIDYFTGIIPPSLVPPEATSSLDSIRPPQCLFNLEYDMHHTVPLVRSVIDFYKLEKEYQKNH